jgi:hypothetical protein
LRPGGYEKRETEDERMTTNYSVLVEQDGKPSFDDGWYSSKAIATLMLNYFKELYPEAWVRLVTRTVQTASTANGG